MISIDRRWPTTTSSVDRVLAYHVKGVGFEWTIKIQTPPKKRISDCRLIYYIDYIHLEESITYAASGHRDPCLEFYQKGVVKNEN